LRTSSLDFFLDLTEIEQKCLVKHGAELPDLPRERGLVGPSQAGVEDFTGYTLDGARDGEVEDVKVFVFGREEFARVDGVDDAAGVFEWAALARSVFATGPSGVDEPAVGVGGLHALCEHGCVAGGVEDDEGCTVAGGEGRDGF
jgi:hypothetical protein